MYYNDHAPPHFHAFYAGTEAVVDIAGIALIAGQLPPRALGMTVEWATLHRDELQRAWESARAGESPTRIDPLP